MQTGLIGAAPVHARWRRRTCSNRTAEDASTVCAWCFSVCLIVVPNGRIQRVPPPSPRLPVTSGPTPWSDLWSVASPPHLRAPPGPVRGDWVQSGGCVLQPGGTEAWGHVSPTTERLGELPAVKLIGLVLRRPEGAGVHVLVHEPLTEDGPRLRGDGRL